MSKIVYRYRTPIPMIFWRNGMLDPSKAIYKNRLAFLTWAFAICPYDSLKFTITKEEGARQSGLTPDQWSTQEEFFVGNGILAKRSNVIKNRPNDYEWVIEKITEEKIIDIEKTPNQNQMQSTEDKGLKEGLENKSPNQTEKSPTESPTKSPTVLRDEIEKNPQPNPQQNPHVNINDKTAINLSLDKGDNVAKPRAREDLSPSCKGKIIAPFNRSTYRLRDGKPLSPRMQNALAKYSPTEMERVRENVKYYEEFIDNGGIVRTTHEQFLQSCITNDLALKREYKGQNLLYAKFIKEEFKMNEMELNKTSMIIRKNPYETPDPIPLESNPKTFAAIIDNYIQAYYSGVNNATRAQ
jgi:hypothetical protein